MVSSAGGAGLGPGSTLPLGESPPWATPAMNPARYSFCSSVKQPEGHLGNSTTLDSVAGMGSISRTHWLESHRAVLITGLTGMRVELGAREFVGHAVVHRDEQLPRLHRGRDEGRALDAAAARDHRYGRVRLKTKARGIGGMNLHVGIGRVKRAEHGGLAGARIGVPLRAGAPTRVQEERKFGVRRFGDGTRRVEEKLRAPIGGVELAVGEKAPLAGRARSGASVLASRSRSARSRGPRRVVRSCDRKVAGADP